MSDTFQWADVLETIARHDTLTESQVVGAIESIMSGNATAAQIGAFIFGIRVKGIQPSELAAAAEGMLSFATPVTLPHPEQAVDIVGTGGDGAHTVNVSTMASLLVASMGIPVVKHGNRAASSKSGGADMLEALGVTLEQQPEDIVRRIKEFNFAFMFARLYHPAMRFAGPVRSELKVPTIFNLLGPLTNPARPQAGLIGCAFKDLHKTMAEAFAQRGDRVLVVRGQDGLDEISVAAPTDVYYTDDSGELHFEVISPKDFGLNDFPIDALRGGDPAYNAQVARDLFDHRASEAVKAAVLMSAAGALVAVNGLKGATLKDALRKEFAAASQHLESDKPQALLAALIADSAD